MTTGKIRCLVVVLGDQLSLRLAPFADFDRRQDAVWMAEASGESEYVWSSKQRTALFLSAMRHFRKELEEAGYPLCYESLTEESEGSDLGSALRRFLQSSSVEKVRATWPGEYRVEQALREACEAAGIELELMEDVSFFCSRSEFERHASGRKQLRMEYFYREQRRRWGILMDGEEPLGGKWNFDSSNRSAFGKEGPEMLGSRRGFELDTITREVIALVERRFAGHPGSLDTFVWPVDRRQALEALERFLNEELPRFGQYQDAMWSGEPFLHHSLLASSMNLKLIDPQEVVMAVEEQHRAGEAPLESAEGFIRQVLGWREFVRGVYWRFMPEYAERNALEATEPLPSFYWSGETEMRCLREAIGQTMRYGYAHHIQRLMVTGLYALLLGTRPQEVHAWYLAVYVDAVEWVELPNTLGMSQYADGGVMASKPYVASGKYIQGMSNYCQDCRFKPELRSGSEACPFTVLYWDFLLRHRETLRGNSRMAMQLKNADRLSAAERKAIGAQASAIRDSNTQLMDGYKREGS